MVIITTSLATTATVLVGLAGYFDPTRYCILALRALV